MFIEVTEKLLDELKHTAHKLGQKKMGDMDNDIRSAYMLLLAIIESAEKGVDARPRLLKRENEETGEYHTHVILTSFCISNEWLGDRNDRADLVSIGDEDGNEDG